MKNIASNRTDRCKRLLSEERLSETLLLLSMGAETCGVGLSVAGYDNRGGTVCCSLASGHSGPHLGCFYLLIKNGLSKNGCRVCSIEDNFGIVYPAVHSGEIRND